MTKPTSKVGEAADDLPSHAPQTHICHYRKDDRGFANFLWAWYILPLHIIVASVFTFIMIYVLNHRHLNICTGSISWIEGLSKCGLQQSDVTSLISAALVVTRLLTAAWFTTSTWRGIYILLEKEGLTLSQLSNMTVYHFPGLPLSLRSGYWWSITAISLLILPAQLIAPLAAGSVSWIPGQSFAPGAIYQTTLPKPGNNWGWLNKFTEEKSRAVLQAAALSSSISTLALFNATTNTKMLSRRHAPSLTGLPVNTTLNNITIPYASIDAFEWVTDVTTLPNWVVDVTTNATNLALDLTMNANPLSRNDPGNAAVLKSTPARDWASYPDPIAFTGQKYVAMLVSRTNNVASDKIACPSLSLQFGDVGLISILRTYAWNRSQNCYAIAKVNLTLGETFCINCPIVSPAIIGADSSEQKLELHTSPLVPVIFDMLPEVMSYMAMMNTSNAPAYDNAEQFLKGTIALAYQASWNALTDLLSDDASANASTGTMVPKATIRVSISTTRMYAWLGLNALLTLAGLWLMWLQCRCSGKTVRDFTLAAVLLDPLPLLAEDRDGFCNAVALSPTDKARGGVVRLVRGNQGTSTFRHRTLVWDGSRECSTELRQRSPSAQEALTHIQEDEHPLLRATTPIPSHFDR
jgi:hypothetical protein